MIKRGTTRITILLGKWAFKVPIMNRSLKHFVKGWLGNVDERDIWREEGNDMLCPVTWSLFGLINVMPRATPITGKFNKQEILNKFKDAGASIDVCSGWKNFGIVRGELVMLDYATCRESSDECSDCDDDCVLKN
jgi:hypothetical protein